jgi:hypothetical protein
MHNPLTNRKFCDKHGNAIKKRTIHDYNQHEVLTQGGQNGKQLLNTMLDMDVGKEIIFSLVGLNNFSCGARMTHRPFRLALVRNLIKRL